MSATIITRQSRPGDFGLRGALTVSECSQDGSRVWASTAGVSAGQAHCAGQTMHFWCYVAADDGGPEWVQVARWISYGG